MKKQLALIKREGELASCLELVGCFEKGVWDSCPNLSDSQSPVKLTIAKYTEAIAWADALLG